MSRHGLLPAAWAFAGLPQVMVFEKSPASLRTTRRGAGLGLDVNGQKALKAIKPGDCKKECAAAPCWWLTLQDMVLHAHWVCGWLGRRSVSCS